MLSRAPVPARGLTLVELMIGLAVLAVGASLAAPLFSQQMATYRVRSAADGMVGALAQARAEAARRNVAVRFELDAAAPGWTVLPHAGGAALARRTAGETPGVTATSSTTSRAVVFLPNGLVDGSGTRLSRITVSSSITGAEARRIDILGGGLIRQCVPAVTAADDPRRC